MKEVGEGMADQMSQVYSKMVRNAWLSELEMKRSAESDGKSEPFFSNLVHHFMYN